MIYFNHLTNVFFFTFVGCNGTDNFYVEITIYVFELYTLLNIY